MIVSNTASPVTERPRARSRRTRIVVAPAIGMAPAVAYTVAFRAGIVVAVVAGIVASLLALVAERALTGRTRWSWLGLAGIALSAGLALLTGNALLFFVRSVVVRAAWGVAFLASALAGRPIVATVSGWLMQPDAARREAYIHRGAFSLVTIVWGIAELIKAIVRGYVMATSSLDRFTVVLIVTGYPVEIGLAAFTVWYLRRAGVKLHDETEALGAS